MYCLHSPVVIESVLLLAQQWMGLTPRLHECDDWLCPYCMSYFVRGDCSERNSPHSLLCLLESLVRRAVCGTNWVCLLCGVKPASFLSFLVSLHRVSHACQF